MFVAVDLEKYRPEKPQIAQVIECKGENIEILWYSGTWSTSWRVYKKRQGRNMIEVKETIAKAAVKLFNFTLTNTGKLKQSVKNQLKEIYSSEQADHSDNQDDPDDH